MATAQVRCCRCNRRLFDIEGRACGTVVIRCPRCRDFSRLDLSSYNRDEGDQAASAPEKKAAYVPVSAPIERH